MRLVGRLWIIGFGLIEILRPIPLRFPVSAMATVSCPSARCPQAALGINEENARADNLFARGYAVYDLHSICEAHS
jgi:hypothetical protein